MSANIPSDPSCGFHHQHVDSEQQKSIEAFYTQASTCPGVKQIAARCPFLVENEAKCPFLGKLVSEQAKVAQPVVHSNGKVGPTIFAP